MKDEEEVRALWREYVARAYEADVFSDGDATRKPKHRRKRPAAGAAAAASGSGGGSGASGAGGGGAGGEDPPPPLPGRRVRVWWPAEKRWFRGLVLSSSAAEGHTIKYEDGEVLRHLMEREGWRWDYVETSGRVARAAGRSSDAASSSGGEGGGGGGGGFRRPAPLAVQFPWELSGSAEPSPVEPRPPKPPKPPKEWTPSPSCEACAGKHRPHTCGKVKRR
ncbi:hypothetical protein EMIHUDRAFT_467953 [Emiliania huxleyi CCMP1516]|uniref:Agenet domain-containing protein n=2 Tax=Emiliania huxleyi TaxID=2903 RepID=A0A0D3KA48_EMIH1|nr:hypothetical protein EMIHUDRAFT_467953 [Emiliania huxleyi CCMP1516]EOD32633.1 hypothetical protein EMIHUDRAFT_467953 [Emiliania huxleyi CCMP1516]|eukprot:XP_005785062.1 hypothetical protein EMIHUDRAFT_467953 [Emiliania huxleyi CCMP1516]